MVSQFKRFKNVVSPFALAMCMFSAPVHAQSWHVVWDAEFAGIDLGDMVSDFSLEKNTYSINGYVKTGGLAAVFAKFKGTVSVFGTRAQNGTIIPKSYYSDQTRKKEREIINMTYEGGNIVDTKYQPQKKWSTSRLPIKPEHLNNARDPASALFLTVPSEQKDDLQGICNRTVRIFDANEVYDLKLSFAKMGGRGVRGVSGPKVTCNVRYVPVAGHRPSEKSIKNLQKNKSLKMTFARLGDSPAFVASHLSMKTGWGKLEVIAR